jgi:hypothetical protein
VRRTGDIYPSRWREKGGGDPRVPALTRLYVHSHLLELPRAPVELPCARQRLHAEEQRGMAFLGMQAGG